MIFNSLSKRCLINKTKWFSLILVASITASCATPQREYRAYINKAPNWQMQEVCGYEGCYPMVDFLVGNKMSVRFDFDKYDPVIQIRLNFLDINDDVVINPGEITATISNGNKIQVKTFRCRDDLKIVPQKPCRNFFGCADTHWELKISPSTHPITEPIHIKKDDGLLVFFDYQQLDGQTIAMEIDKAFTTNSRAMDVPIIYFRPNRNYEEKRKP